MFDKTNTWNFGQGGLRYAKFDNEAAKCAISRIKADNMWTGNSLSLWGKPSIVITHINEYNDGLIENLARENDVKIYTSDNEETIKESE